MKIIGALKERGCPASHAYISVNISEERECKSTIKRDAAGNNRKH